MGEKGAGAVFFAGCSLRCSYCQNRAISRRGDGRPMSPRRLREIFQDLTGQGAACLDLVTPTHFTPAISEALGNAPWPIPVVWNSSGYELPETLRLLEGRVQVYLPDLKYAIEDLARAFSGAGDYPRQAKEAILEMFRQTGPYRLEDGLLTRGVLIRHLILPGQLENTRRVMDWVAETFRPGEVLFSLMGQFTPPPGAVPPFDRRVTAAEYRSALRYLSACGITDGFTQDPSAAKECYTPEFFPRGLS